MFEVKKKNYSYILLYIFIFLYFIYIYNFFEKLKLLQVKNLLLAMLNIKRQKISVFEE